MESVYLLTPIVLPGAGSPLRRDVPFWQFPWQCCQGHSAGLFLVQSRCAAGFSLRVTCYQACDRLIVRLELREVQDLDVTDKKVVQV